MAEWHNGQSKSGKRLFNSLNNEVDVDRIYLMEEIN